MFDLSQAVVKGEVQPQAIQEPVVEQPQAPTTEIPEPINEPTVNTQVDTQASAPKDDFPADKFDGKFSSWDEVKNALNSPKQESPKYDEFLQKVIDKYTTDGSLEDFFKAYSVNYDNLPDEEILKRNFSKQYDGLEQKIIDKLWEKEKSKYTIDPEEYPEEEVEVGKALLKRDADRLRTQFKEEQQKYIQPQRQQVDINQLQQTVLGMPEVQKLRSDRKLTLEVDGQAINYELSDPDFVVNTMVDDAPFYNLFMDNGKVNPSKWASVVEFARNPQAVLKAVLDQGKTLARAEIEAELKNSKLPSATPQTASAPGDFKSQLLQAFVERGKTI